MKVWLVFETEELGEYYRDKLICLRSTKQQADADCTELNRRDHARYTTDEDAFYVDEQEVDKPFE